MRVFGKKGQGIDQAGNVIPAEAGPKIRHAKTFFENMVLADDIAFDAGCCTDTIGIRSRYRMAEVLGIEVTLPIKT
jgi:hypothetical protein